MLVGTEFTVLSEWKREDLLWNSSSSVTSGKDGKAKRRYIFEIFDQPSTVEYYESFAAHAFESSSSVSSFF